MRFIMPATARAMISVAMAVAAAIAGWIYLWPASSSSVAQSQSAPGPKTAPGVEWVAAPDAAASRPAIPSLTTPVVVLSGVSVGTAGGNLAIVSVDHGPDTLVRVGDAMSNSMTVVRIDDDSMAYRFAGTELRVFVKPRQTVTTVVKPDAPPKQYPGFIAGAPAMARAVGTEPGSGNDAFRRAIDKKMQSIAAGH